MQTYQYEIVNEKSVNAQIDGALRFVKDLSPAFVTMKNDWFKNNRRVFSLKSKGEYKDLTKATKAYKLRRWGVIYPILKGFGRLEMSLTLENSGEDVVDIQKTSLVLGTTVPYAIYHQATPESSHKRIPFRPFIFNARVGGKHYQEQGARFTRILQTHITNYFKRNPNARFA